MVRCTTREINLTEGGYQALSYVWGSQEQPYRAIVQDARGVPIGYLPLTSNLNHALHDLWRAKDLKEKVFWIDQICIDQDNDEEKNHQVAMMGRIYKSANSVITYLGPAVDAKLEKSGIQLLDDLNRHFSPVYKELQKCNSLGKARDQRLLERFREFEISENVIKHKQWHVVMEWIMTLAYDEYATRLWIIQEQVLNDQINMLRGPNILAWDAVAILPALFNLGFLPPGYMFMVRRIYPSPGLEDPIKVADATFSLWLRRRGSVTRGLSLEENLYSYWRLNCQDPRDHIYALLAISDDIEQLDIKPDYAQPVVECFIRTTSAILMHLHELRFLSFVCQLNDVTDRRCPSWSLNFFPIHRELAEMTPRCKAHPCSTLHVTPRFHTNNTVLVLKGRVIDKVTFVTPQLHPAGSGFGGGQEDLDSFLADLLWTWSQVILNLGITIKNAAALCRAIVCDHYPTGLLRDSPPDRTIDASGLWGLLSYLMDKVAMPRRLRDANNRNIRAQYEHLIAEFAVLMTAGGRTLATPPTDPSINRSTIDSFEKALGKRVMAKMIARGRTFCVTEQKRACNGMRRANEGDMIASFQGAHTLFVLRPVGDRYQLIGEAYVSGWMDGEAYKGLDPDEVDYDIELV
jgi:hypothetical protein